MPEILGLVAASVELCRLGAEAVFWWRNGVVAAAARREARDRSDRAQLRAACLHGTDMIRFRGAVRGLLRPIARGLAGSMLEVLSALTSRFLLD